MCCRTSSRATQGEKCFWREGQKPVAPRVGVVWLPGFCHVEALVAPRGETVAPGSSILGFRKKPLAALLRHQCFKLRAHSPVPLKPPRFRFLGADEESKNGSSVPWVGARLGRAAFPGLPEVRVHAQMLQPVVNVLHQNNLFLFCLLKNHLGGVAMDGVETEAEQEALSKWARGLVLIEEEGKDGSVHWS